MRRISIPYALMRPLVNWAIRLFYRNLQVKNADLVRNSSAPVLLISNHQNALMDPLLCCISAPKQLNFLTRADVFKKPLARKLLFNLNMLPVYRPHDKVNILESNAPTFRESLTRLENHQIISLFPEGTHQPDQNLKPFKKGAARLIGSVFDAGKSQEIIIQPVGLHFTNILHSGYPGFVHFGEQLVITKAELDLTPENRSRTVLSITNRLRDLLEKNVVHFDEGELYSKKIFVFRVLQWEALFSKKGGGIPDFKALEVRVNEFTTLLEGVITDQEINDLESSSFGMPAAVLAAKPLLRSKFKRKLLLLIPIYVIGFLFTAIPYYLGRSLSNKMVKDVCFTSTAKIVLGSVIIPIFWTVLLLVTLTLVQSVWVLFCFLALVFCGAIFLKYHTSYRILNLSKKFIHSKASKGILQSIRSILN